MTAKHFHLSSFTSRLKSVLSQFPHIKPEKLEIEILESVVLGDLQHVQKVIEECKALGVRFALDDFGTGYSSLSYLKRLAVNVIKIDQSFVRNLLDDKGDLALVQAISSLAVTFGHEVIGEGVETIEQGVLLMRLGCDVAQGFGVSGPMPPGEVAHWAKQFVLDPKWRAWSNSDWDLKAFPLLVAQYDIQEWVNTVVKPIERGNLSKERACFTNESQCRFGAWYHSDGFQRFGDLQVFRDIGPIHREFHRVGNEIVHLYVDEQTDLAQKKCPDLYALVDEMFLMLDELQQQAFIQ
ncbi:MAG: EAL domain-containing protein [Cycloclasticus sp.]